MHYYENIKLFDRLEVPYSNDHFKDECCLADLSEKEIDLLDNIPSADNLSDHDISTLYYISGYIAARCSIGMDAVPTEELFKASEFTRKVSRGLLKQPTEDLFELGKSLYVYYKDTDDKSCSTKLLKAFNAIYESFPCTFPQINDILERYVNCFSKGFSTKETDKIKREKKEMNTRKERKFRHT